MKEYLSDPSSLKKKKKKKRFHGENTIPGAGLSVLVLEASDGVGGRVRTDEVDGFLLDRGFHIFLTSYPAAKSELDYDDLQLKEFYAGALVRVGGKWER